MYESRNICLYSHLYLYMYLYFCSLCQYYADCHGIMYLVDSSDKSRIEESLAILGEYREPHYFCRLPALHCFTSLILLYHLDTTLPHKYCCTTLLLLYHLILMYHLNMTVQP